MGAQCGLCTDSGNMRTILTVLWVLATSNIGSPSNITDTRTGKAFSLFSIVQFPNQQCTASSSSTTYGTCYTSSECTSKGGSSDGNCAAGFGVCCVITSSTCSTTINTNTTYIRNPNYPSSYTPSSTGTCAFTFSKVSDDICQLRLDFQTFSGFATTTPNGACSDYMTAAGQTGKDPPSICGTNTDYHMYVEFGATSTDTISITNTYASTTTAKTFNILARQISCTASYKAPTDCVQYFTGTAGSVKSYNYAGGQVLAGQRYNNCIRTEKGYCAIQWKESSTTSPDPFSLDSISVVGANGANPPTPAILCDTAYIAIPNLSPDGIVQIPIPVGPYQSWQSQVCGTNFGIEGMGTISSALVSRQQPFVLGVYTIAPGTAVSPSTTTGFNLDYTQLPC